jgi:hypothetical protein
LDIKYDRTSYNQNGMPTTVSVYYRDYRNIDGLQVPGTIETGVGSRQGTEKLVIEKIALNPTLEDRVFARPGLPSRRHMVTIEAEPAQTPTPMSTAPTGPPAAASPGPGTAPK